VNRVSVAAAILAAAAGGAAAASIGPAMAAQQAAAPAHHASSLSSSSSSSSRTIAKARTPVEKAPLADGQPAVPGLSTANLAAETDKGKYITVVHCAGVDAPPPIRIGEPGTPLTVTGIDPPSQEMKLLADSNAFQPVYSCTVVVELQVAASAKKTAKKASCEIAGAAGATGGSGTAGGGRKGAAGCTKKVTLNTGFGGLASQVAHHRPVG
jgi:hypothetical protein